LAIFLWFNPDYEQIRWLLPSIYTLLRSKDVMVMLISVTRQ